MKLGLKRSNFSRSRWYQSRIRGRLIIQSLIAYCSVGTTRENLIFFWPRDILFQNAKFCQKSLTSKRLLNTFECFETWLVRSRQASERASVSSETQPRVLILPGKPRVFSSTHVIYWSLSKYLNYYNVYWYSVKFYHWLYYINYIGFFESVAN